MTSIERPRKPKRRPTYDSSLSKYPIDDSIQDPKERLRAKRRAKYELDLAWRERMKAQARERNRQVRAGNGAGSRIKDFSFNVDSVLSHGVEQAVVYPDHSIVVEPGYSYHSMASAIGIRESTLRLWISEDKFPVPICRKASPGMRPVYTAAEALTYCKIISQIVKERTSQPHVLYPELSSYLHAASQQLREDM